MALWETQGLYRDACVVYDDVYIAVERVIDGQTVLCIEALDDDLPVDCGVRLGAGATATLAWLPNTEVEIVLDGAAQPAQMTGSGGIVVYAREAESEALIGLGWPDVEPDRYPGWRWLVETLPVDAELQDGTMFGRKRRIVWVAFRMHETNGLIVNGSRVAMRRYGGQLLDRPNPRVSDTRTLKGLLGWDYEGRVAFGETEPTQATVLALSWAVSV